MESEGQGFIIEVKEEFDIKSLNPDFKALVRLLS